jgi:protein SCO1/2
MNRRAMTIRNAFATALALTLAATLAACTPAERPPLEGANIGGPFTLTDKAGKAVSWNDFAGKYRIVYFGYTFCPDACPMDVSVMMKGFNQFAKDEPKLAAQVQPIFITIDPARDTAARVGEFAAAFSPRMIGLTGTPEQIAATAKATETSGGYLMDHSRTAYLMDRDGKPLAVLPTDKQDAGAIAAELAKWVK